MKFDVFSWLHDSHTLCSKGLIGISADLNTCNVFQARVASVVAAAVAAARDVDEAGQAMSSLLLRWSILRRMITSGPSTTGRASTL